MKKSLSRIYFNFRVFAQQKKLKLNLNSRLVVIFVLILAKPLSETAQQKFKSRSVLLGADRLIAPMHY